MKTILALLLVSIAVCSALDGWYTEDKYGSTLYACRSADDANTVYGTYSALGNLGSFTATSSDDGVSFQGDWVEKKGTYKVYEGRMNFTRVGANWEGWYDKCTEECDEDEKNWMWSAVRQGGVSTGAPFCMRPETEPLPNSLVGTWVGGAGFTTLSICQGRDDPTMVWGSSAENNEFFVGYSTEQEDGQTARGTKYFSLERDVGSDTLWENMRTGVWFFRQVADNQNMIYGQESICTKNEEGTRCAGIDEGRWVQYRRASGTSAGDQAPWAACNANADLQNSAGAIVASFMLIAASVLVVLF